MQGVFLEHGDCFSSCMKIGEKTINVKGKVTNLWEKKKQELRHFTQPPFHYLQHNFFTFRMIRHYRSSVIMIYHQVTGDFIVEECEVDGSIASQMKPILVRQ